MCVAVAHQSPQLGRAALREAAREAVFRGTDLAVLHVAESLDNDVTEAYRAGISDEIERALGRPPTGRPALGAASVAGGRRGRRRRSEAILGTVGEVGAELLVIGGRRRSPVGKAFMGSLTQKIILDADVPCSSS